MVHPQSERAHPDGRALGEDVDAASAAYRVGCHDASHFSREYKRLFGAPPMRDVERLRGVTTPSAGL